MPRRVDTRFTDRDVDLSLAWTKGDARLTAWVEGVYAMARLGAGGAADLLAQAATRRHALTVVRLTEAITTRDTGPLRGDRDLALPLGIWHLTDGFDPAAAIAMLHARGRDEDGLADRFMELAMALERDYGALARHLEDTDPPGFVPTPHRRALALARGEDPAAWSALVSALGDDLDPFLFLLLEGLAAAPEADPGDLDQVLSMVERSPLGVTDAALLTGPMEALAGGRDTGRVAAIAAQDWDGLAEALEADSDAAEDSRLAAAMLSQAGLILMDRIGDPLDAATALRRALDRSPGYPWALELLSEALLAGGDMEALAELHPGLVGAAFGGDCAALADERPLVAAACAVTRGSWDSLAMVCEHLAAQKKHEAPAYLTMAALLTPDDARAMAWLDEIPGGPAGFLPAALCKARLAKAGGRHRIAMEILASAGIATPSPEVRIELLLEAASAGRDLGDPEALGSLYRDAARLLLIDPDPPMSGGELARALARGGKWHQHGVELLRQARRQGIPREAAKTLLAIAATADDTVADLALQMCQDLLPPNADGWEDMIRLMEARGWWVEVADLLERQAQETLDPVERRGLLERVEVIAMRKLGDSGRAERVRTKSAPPEGSGAEAHPQDLEVEAEALLERARAASDWDEAISCTVEAAALLDQAGRGQRAEELLEEVLAKDASDPRALELMADMARRRGEWDAVRELLGRLTQVEPSQDRRVEMLLNRARIASEKEGDPEAAARDYHACLQLDPTCSEALGWLERYHAERDEHEALRLIHLMELEFGATSRERRLELLLSLAELEAGPLDLPEDAVKHAQRALDLSPGDPGILRLLANAAKDAGRWKVAVDALESLARQIQNASERSLLYMEIARIYRDHLGGTGVVQENAMVAFICDNTNREAFQLLEEIYQAEGGWKELAGIYDVALAATGYPKAELLAKKGRLLAHGLGQPEEGVELLLQALELDPTNQELRRDIEALLGESRDEAARLRMLDILIASSSGPARVELLLEAADVAASEPMDLDAAREYYRRAALLSPPGDERALSAYALVCEEQERWRDLAAVYEEVASKSPDQRDSIRFMSAAAKLYEQRLRDPAAAIGIHRRILERNPDDPTSLAALARLYELTRAWDELLEISHREMELLEPGPERAMIWFRIGAILETQRRDDERAEEAYLAALAEDQRCFPALHGLRDLYGRANRWTEVIQTLEREASLWENPRDKAAVLVRIGDILLDRVRDRDAAVAAYRRAMRTSPGFAPAAKALLPLLVERGAWEEAAPLARLVTRVAAEEPDRGAIVQALGLRAKVSLRLHDLEDCSKSLKLALDIDPSDPEVRGVLRELTLDSRVKGLPTELLTDLLERASAQGDPWLPILEGLVLEARRRPAEALERYEAGFEAMGPSMPSVEHLLALLARMRRWADVVEHLLRIQREAGDPMDRLEAQALAGEITMDRLGDPTAARELLAAVLERLRSMRESVEDETYGLEHEKLYRRCLFLTAQACYLDRAWDEGLEAMEALVEAESDDPRDLHGPLSVALYLYYLGRLQRDGQGDDERATESFYRSVQEGPYSADAVLALARRLWAEGELEDMTEVVESNVSLLEARWGPSEGYRLRESLAYALSLEGAHDQAMGILAQALAQGEADPVTIHMGQAWLAFMAGEVATAREELDRAMAAGGDPKVVLTRMAELFTATGDDLRATWAAQLAGVLRGAPLGPWSMPSFPLAAEALDEHVVHLNAKGVLFRVWPHAAKLVDPDTHDIAARPLGGPRSRELEMVCAQIARRLGVHKPPLLVAQGQRLPVAVLADALVVDEALLTDVEPLTLAFWVAGPMYLMSRGLGSVLYPDQGMVSRIAEQALKLLRWVVDPGFFAASLLSRRPPRRVLRAVGKLLAREERRILVSRLPDPSRFLDGVLLSLPRVGMIAVGEPAAALSALTAWTGMGKPLGGIAPNRYVVDLLHYCLGPEHQRVREHLGVRG